MLLLSRLRQLALCLTVAGLPSPLLGGPPAVPPCRDVTCIAPPPKIIVEVPPPEVIFQKAPPPCRTGRPHCHFGSCSAPEAPCAPPAPPAYTTTQTTQYYLFVPTPSYAYAPAPAMSPGLT